MKKTPLNSQGKDNTFMILFHYHISYTWFGYRLSSLYKNCTRLQSMQYTNRISLYYVTWCQVIHIL